MGHSHDNDEGHHHHGHHGHDHDHEQAPEMGFSEKLEKLLNHWIKHNREHVQTYRKWVERAKEEGMPEIGDRIEEAAQTSLKVDASLESALESLKEKKKA